MPRGDRTGPVGMGPGTGRGLGYCAGFNQPGFMTNWGGRGVGGGFGRGWRHRNFAFNAPVWTGNFPGYFSNVPVEQTQQMTAEQEIAMLKAESKNLQKSLKIIEKRLAELTEEKE